MSARNRFILTALVLLGLAFRSYHYFREPSMWHDEAAVVVNVLSKGYVELLGPLRMHNPSPPLFLWLEKAVSVVLGDGLYSLRLPPFLASCAALPLFAWGAVRLLGPRAAPWAVFLFSVSEQLSWHACEAKPYAFDVLTATVLLCLFAVMEGGPAWRRALVFAAPAPFLMFLSYPACFVYGGVLFALAPAVWRERRWASATAFALLAAVVGGTFLALILGPIRAQHDPEVTSCWVNAFPDFGRAWTIPAWTLFSTLDVFRYCCKPLGQILAPLAILGGAVLWRRGRADLALMLVAPALLALGASFAHRYPYGGARVLIYAAPALILLIGAAVPLVVDWLRRRNRFAPSALALLFLPPLVASGHSVVFPWERADTAGAAAYVLAHRRPADMVAGNDWTDLYYFRRLGPAFLAERAPETAERCWVVFTEEGPCEGRLRDAYGMGPAGWDVVERREFKFTTVLLMCRPNAE